MTRWIIFTALAAIVGVLNVPRGDAQSNAARPGFEVASVRLSVNCDSGGVSAGISPGRLSLHCASVRALIRTAYGAFAGAALNSRRLEVEGGPGWLDSDRYDISAKTEGNASPAEMMGPLLQALLEERFGVKVHMGQKDAAVYALTVAKSKPELRPSKEGSCIPMDLNNLARTAILRQDGPTPKYCGSGSAKGNGTNMIMDWYGVSMAEFAGRTLSGYVDRPVVDKTGLTGTFDIHLEFARDSAVSGPIRLNGVASPDLPASTADPAGPSIFTALQEQLGLKLSAARGPLEIIVVDRVERPSGN